MANAVRAVLPIGAASSLASLLVACTAITAYRIPDVMGAVRNDVGLSGTRILGQERCRVGQAFAGAPSVALRDCLYVETDSKALLVTYDRTSATYRTFASIDAHTQGIALKVHHSVLGGAEQIQVLNDDGYLVFDFVDSSAGAPDQAAALARAYEYLKRLGIPEIQGREFIPMNTGQGSILIPVYVPARR